MGTEARIYLAVVKQPFGDYKAGVTCEVSKAPDTWAFAGSQHTGWIVTAAGREGTWISDMCAREVLTTVRSTVGKPYRVETQAARLRRDGYIRHRNMRQVRVRAAG